MIEWMQTLPQDAEVECGVEKSSGPGRYMRMVPVDIESCDVIRYTSDYDYDRDMAGKTFVMIRGE